MLRLQREVKELAQYNRDLEEVNKSLHSRLSETKYELRRVQINNDWLRKKVEKLEEIILFHGEQLLINRRNQERIVATNELNELNVAKNYVLAAPSVSNNAVPVRSLRKPKQTKTNLKGKKKIVTRKTHK